MAMEATMEVESIYAAVYQDDGSEVYLVDRVDLIHNLYRLWKGSQPTSLVTPHLELSTPMHVGHLWEFVPEAALEDLGLSQ